MSIKIKNVSRRDASNLTIDKTYEVVSFDRSYYDGNPGLFTFPAYVTVVGDNGKNNTCHASRFQTMEGVNFDTYIEKEN